MIAVFIESNPAAIHSKIELGFTGTPSQREGWRYLGFNRAEIGTERIDEDAVLPEITLFSIQVSIV